MAAPAKRETKDVPLLFFDLESDPLENHNIATQAPDGVARLSKQLPPPNPDPRFGARGEEQDKKDAQTPENLGC